MGDFARDFAAALAKDGVILTPDMTVPWLSGKGHLHEAVAEAPEDVLFRLRDVYKAVGGSEELLAAKRPSRCGIDFQLDDLTFVELDEVQHFSTKRLRTLQLYKGLDHSVDLDLYGQSCRRFSAEADKAWAKRIKNEFDFVGGRTAQRAYLDAVRDLLAPVFGVRLFRIPAPEGNLRLALDRFKATADRASDS